MNATPQPLRPGIACLSLAVVLALGGCATAPKGPPLPLTGDPIIDGQTYIAQGPKRDKVLWQYRTGLAAMRISDFALAREMFHDAILSMGAMMQPDADTKKSRSYFYSESKKTFYGEPYERVMAWFYLGILYWMQGEPDNARACFRSAQFQDSDAENNEYKSDYAILDYLEGMVTDKLGGDGSDAFKRAEAIAKVKLPPYNKEANVVLFIDFGAAPVKYAAGEYGEELRFKQGASPVVSARVTINNQSIAIAPTDNLYYQATTRGGRVMDHVLGNKAVFKKSTDAFGNVAVVSGAILASNQDTQTAGLAVLGAGIVSKIFSAATTPDADTRTWQNLPQYLSFAVFKLAPGTHDMTVEFLNNRGVVLPQFTKNLQLRVAEGLRDSVFYISDQSRNSVTPPSSL